jgi:hypothetical protein
VAVKAVAYHEYATDRPGLEDVPAPAVDADGKVTT